MAENLARLIKDAVDASLKETREKLDETQARSLENQDNIDLLKKQVQICKDGKLAKILAKEETEEVTFSRNVRPRRQPPTN
ncbi:hypothetical protein RHGRI_013413 [Rhododendron griersonianum]|uniref:Uncharacterized protein n=1 Tax=Rhododendron griersonianum TaxID=479676 RepID=A0AAV6K5T6_9ERIC|nr:hypothetical protein RHGRI_013413 [Rhododendron griersonianum]